MQPAILEALAGLPGVLATLNYDNLIELGTGRVPITWQDDDKVSRFSRHAHRRRAPSPRLVRRTGLGGPGAQLL